MDKLDNYCNKLGFQKLDQIEELKKLSMKLYMAPRHLGFMIILFVIILVFFEFGSEVISEVVGFIYPAYMSFKAIESEKKDDDKQWLTYWVVYCFLTIADLSLGYFMQMIPFYSLLKVLFYFYLFHPNLLGATVIYNYVLRPVLMKYEIILEQSNINQSNHLNQFHHQYHNTINNQQ